MILRVVMEKMVMEVVVIVMKECCQVYCHVRRDVLDKCLLILGVEEVNVEEVQRIER
ncbi:putative cullin repeat-like-containing domain superfamily [Helianthus anomalus]